ncbi:MAG: hypothetical protein ASARMPREDX12_003383 [Alectoria sarmentosa]|nr:MAG: hypothetical protein ASARMPREDX12_003383 [Alectoria sarmentosa]
MTDSLQSFRTHQPGKTLWMLVAIADIIIRMLYLSVYFIPKSTRQHPEWTYRQALTNELFRVTFYHMTLTKLTLPPISMKPGAEKERFVSMSPQNGIYNGVLQDSAVQPAIVGGTWYPKLFQLGDEQKTVILHFHGGSFLWGTGRESDCGFLASTILKRIPATALFVQYRIASDPACTFPAAVQDAVTAYKHLLNMEIPASNIVISGDSAGGNVAIALLRYLSSADGNNLPSPLAVLLWSPSVDLATQCDPRSIDLHKNNKSDYITGFTLVWGVKAYIPRSMDPTHPYFSPLQHPFSTPIPLWIMVGGTEVLYDTIVGFADRMRNMEGNRVTLYEAPNAPHDIVFIGHVLGWAKEADAGAQAAAEFLKGLGSDAKS